MSITAYKQTIYADATSLVVFRGLANVAVAWSITSGPGDIEGLTNSTDAQGVACAVYTADGTTGEAVVAVSYGA